MAVIKVVTDSACDLPTDLLAEWQISTVPLEVRLGDFDPEQLNMLEPGAFWELAWASSVNAETAAPPPGAFALAFQLAAQDGADGVVCVSLSAALSATYQSACLAAEMVADTIPVEVIDSRTATMGQGLLVLEAADAAASGADLSIVAATVHAHLNKVRVLGTLDTLENLRRGGRIGSARALIGSLLAIKPVIEVRNGVVEAESRQRTRTRSLHYLAEQVAAAAPLRRLAIVHAAASDVDAMASLLAGIVCKHPMIISQIGPVIGAHTGVGTIGVCFEPGT